MLVGYTGTCESIHGYIEVHDRIDDFVKVMLADNEGNFVSVMFDRDVFWKYIRKTEDDPDAQDHHESSVPD